jgi:rhodanese-related sulfurtransferase
VSPASRRRALALTALVAAGLAAWVGEPSSRPAAAPAAGEVSALTVASWLHERAAGLRILDLRAPEAIAEGRLPRAEPRTAADLASAAFDAGERVVIYGDDGFAASRVVASLRERGVDALLLRGGYASWVGEVLSPEIPAGAEHREPWRSTAELSRYFGGRPRVAGAPARSWRGC